MKAATIAKVSFALAALDLWLATLCAICGDAHFIAFMLLCGLMWTHGLYFKAKAEKEAA